MAMGERESLETRYAESLVVVYVLCMSLLSLISAKRQSLRP